MRDRLKLFLNELKHLGLIPIGFFYCMFMNLLLLLTGINDGSGALRDQELLALFAGREWLIFLINLVLGPFLEELLFRKLLYRKLFREKLGWKFLLSALLSTVAFAVLHLNIPQGIYAFFLGLILCLIMEKTGSLFACIFVHAAANLLTMLVDRIPALNSFVDAHRLPICIGAFVLCGASILYFLYPQKKRKG